MIVATTDTLQKCFQKLWTASVCFRFEWTEEWADGSSVGATEVCFLRGDFVGAIGTEVGETGATVGVLVVGAALG